MVATPALTVPTTALGDLVRAQYTPPRSRRLTTNAVRMIAVLSIVLVAAGAIGATTAHAWFLDDAVSRIANFCSPNDVVTPSNSFGGLDGAFGLNSFDENNIEGQKTILPNAGGYYDDGATIDANYYRYGFSALKLHSYGTGCGNLVARYIPGLYNIALTLFVYIPVALTMLMVNLALGSTLGAFFSTLLSPLFIALSQVMKPIVTILAPFGTLYAFVKYRERVGKVAAAGIYALVCAGFVYWGANGNSGALQKIVESSDKIVSGAVGTVTSQIADSMFPPVSSASKGDSGTSITYGQASGAKNNNSKPAMSINNSLWKGIPLATWSTAQMGPEMTEAAASNSDKDQAKPWQNRLLNANHIGMASSNKVDNEGLIMLAGVEAWNSRSYAINGQDTKTDAWTEGWDAEVDGEVAAKKPSVWQTVPQLADAGTLCHDRFHVPDGKGSGKAEHNRWMFNGSCVPEDNDAAWIDYYKGTSWPETGSVIMTGAMGAILVMIVCLPVAFYVALQKALMYWLLIFSVVFIGIASFGDEKRQRFAKAYFGEFFSSIMKQVGAVAALVILSYMVAAIIMSPGIPAIIKPMMVLILGSSLWLLALIARKIAKAAIAGDASIVHSTARAPVTAAKTAAKAAALAGAAAATGGAALGAVGFSATGATGMQAVAAGAKVAKGAIAASGGLKGAAIKSAKAILTNPSARGQLPNLLPGRMGQIANKALSASDLVSSVMKPPSKEDKERMAKDPIAQTANYLYESAQGPGRKPTPLGPRATGKQHRALGRTPTTDPKTLREHGQAIGYPSSDRTIGTAVSARSVQSPVNNYRSNATTGEIVNAMTAQLVAAGKGKGDTAQTKQWVQAGLDGSSSQVVDFIPTSGQEADPSKITSEVAKKAAAIAGGDPNNLPAAVATAARAEKAESQWTDIVGSSHEMSSSFQRDLVGHERKGDSVAMAANTSANEAINDTEKFMGKVLDSGVYGDGDNVLGNLDVRHPASAAMMTAYGAAMSDDAEGYKNATAQVAAMVQQYGLPSAVSGMHAAEGSELATRSADTFIDAASMMATWEPPENPAEWSDFRTKLQTMEMSLSQDAQDSAAGKAMHTLCKVAANPASTIDDIRVAGGTLVTALNTEVALGTSNSKALEAAGASRNARAKDAFTAADYASRPEFKDIKGGFGDL